MPREGPGGVSAWARRRTSVRRPAADTTAAACTRPGWRVNRSTGPEIDTAATTLPDGARTGADTEATPGSRSPMLWAQPRRRTAERVVAVKRAPCRPRCSRSGSSHASRICAAEPARIVSAEPDGDGVAQAHGALGRGDADPLVALAAVELGRLAGVVAQRDEHRARGGEQPVLARPPWRARRAAARARTGPAGRGRPGGGARAPRRAGARWGGPARWRRRAGPGSRGRPPAR